MDWRGLLFLLVLSGFCARGLFNPIYAVVAWIALILGRGLWIIWVPFFYETIPGPLLVMIYCILLMIFHRRFPLQYPVPILLLLIFIGWIFLSYGWNRNNLFSDQYFVDLLRNFFVFVVVYSLSKDIKTTEYFIQCIVTVLGILAIISYYNYGWEGYELAVPVYKNFDRNEFSSNMIMGIPLCYGIFVVSDKKWKNVACGILGVLFSMVIIISYSRGAFLSLLVLMGLLIILFNENRKQLLIVTLIVAFGFGLRISGDYWDRMKGISNYEEDASSMGRVATYEAAKQMIFQHPVIGIGMGDFKRKFYEYCPEPYRQYGAPGKNVHSIYLQVLAETGIIGFILYSATFLLVIRSAMHRLKDPELSQANRILIKSLLASMGGYVTALFFLPGAYSNYLFLLSGILLDERRFPRFQREIMRRGVDG